MIMPTMTQSQKVSWIFWVKALFPKNALTASDNNVLNERIIVISVLPICPFASMNLASLSILAAMIIYL